MPTKTIVCLANSIKHAGRCVAGIESVDDSPGQWIRPVSDRHGHEVSDEERQYEDGSDAEVGDIIRVPLIGPRPEGFQSENWLLNPKRYWEKVGTASWEDLLGLLQPEEPLWINGHETSNGVNDRVPADLLGSIADSLRLIRVSSLTIWVHAGYSKREVVARFIYAGDSYALKVTDPVYKGVYLAKDNGVYELGECLLTISLSEVFNEFAYKLVAAIVEKASP